MTKLTDFLDTAAQAYYRGTPIITDEQFDRLADSCGYNKVGAVEGTVKHYKQMYSLQKFYEDEGRNRPLEGMGDVSSSVKLDGAAISLLYVDGELVRALTRGDGIEGTDITDKVLASKLVPHTLNPDRINVPPVLQITGEVVAPINIPNARNYAAGALNLKSAEEFKERVLSFIAYGVYPYLTPKHSTDMAALRALGFGVCNELNLEKIFPSDGMVFRVNSNELFDEMGYTAKAPKGAYALKLRAEHVETKLLDVEWQVSRNGKVTPVAILEPVMIEDAIVSRATLNNPGFIEALGIEIGDTLAVIRAGSVIPCILHKVEG
jgi:DNA ligase (NAD+)